MDECKTNGKVVDHLLEDTENNCYANLSLVSTSANATKRSMTKHMKPFGDLIEAYDGRYYRMQYTYVSSLRRTNLKSIRYYTDDFNDVVKFREYLRRDRGKHQWELRSSRKGLPTNSDMYSATGDFYSISPVFPKPKRKVKACDIQKYLVELPLSDFEKYEDLNDI